MVMDGIVKGDISRKKPVVDGIVSGCEKKKGHVAPDTLGVTPSATRLGNDTFGSGLTPQGVGNIVGKGKK